MVEFKEVENNKKPNQENYHYENLRIAREFSKGLVKEMGKVVKGIVIFGSTSLNTNTSQSDVDILVILDNISVIVTQELKDSYYLIVNNLVDNISERLHITTMNITDLWDLARKGDPVIINILRTGFPLYDENLFEPIQFLLRQGRIKPTRETVNNYHYKGDELIEMNTRYLENAISDLYYGVIDLAHAALILRKVVPESPKNIKQKFKDTFKGTYLEKHGETLEELYKAYKDIENKRFSKLDGKTYDKYKKKAESLKKDIDTFTKEELKKTDMFEL